MLLELTADLGKLSRIRDFVGEAVVALGIDASALDDLLLAVDEAVTNILIHGYGGPGEIELEISVYGADALIRLRDQAPAFDADFDHMVDLRAPGGRQKPGGLGLYLIQNAMDKVSHRVVDGGNELTMTKLAVVSTPGS